MSSSGVVDEALGGMRLSHLAPELREKLLEQARQGRESGYGGADAPSLRLSSDSAGSLGGLFTPGGYSALGGEGRPSMNAEAEAEVQAWLEREAAMRAAGAQSQPGSASAAAASSSATPAAGGGCVHAGEGGGDCATCAELKARYAEHDEWLDSLQRAAEGVVAANQQAQAIAERQLGPDAVAQTPKLPGGSPKE